MATKSYRATEVLLLNSTAVLKEVPQRNVMASENKQATEVPLPNSTAVLKEVPQRDLSSSTSSETSNLDSDTDSEPLYELPPNMSRKLPKSSKRLEKILTDLKKILQVQQHLSWFWGETNKQTPPPLTSYITASVQSYRCCVRCSYTVKRYCTSSQ
jgi:hypothetical protein